MKLVIGNKNYSTWSLRPWLLLSHFGIEFEEVQESLQADAIGERLGRYSPTRKVPVLIDGELTVWDSLSICEYVSEVHLGNRGWPSSPAQRATARSISAEMHAGFSALRAEMPMNIRARRHIDLSEAAMADLKRIDAIWSLAPAHKEGPWLFGDFSIADCMYAPVALRLLTYEVPLSEPAREYASAITEHPCIRNWMEAALTETEVVPEDETGVPRD